MKAPVELRLSEWSAAHPDTCEKLRGLALPPELKPVLDEFARTNRLTIVELARGVQITTTSWIGRLDLGVMTLTIAPKINGIPLATLLRYAYGLRDLELQAAALHSAAVGGLQDLLVLQLVTEARELIARGLHRDYERRAEDLGVPRGRIAFARMPDTFSRARAVLPCVHHPRTLAHALNVALSGALALGARVAGDPVLRLDAWRLVQLLAEDVPPVDLTMVRLEAAERKMDRRHGAYGPALRLARLLLEGAGLNLEEMTASVPLPGFLFDMNMFFQALITRFLREHLRGATFVGERALRDMYAWDAPRNPKGKVAPRPRPDILVMNGARVLAVLDAKYRDLWSKGLPHEMLYQLTLYALGHRGKEREATIIYPTVATYTREQAVVLRDPWSGTTKATVVLRACDLSAMAAALGDAERSRAAVSCGRLADMLVFGTRQEGHPDDRRRDASRSTLMPFSGNSDAPSG